MRYVVFASVLATTLAGVAHARCTDPRVPEVRASIAQSCPCTGNHGRYVSCVAHAVRSAVSNNEIDVNCKGAVVRCAARSTCGKKESFVTCAICDTGTCTNGFCDDGTTACMDSSQCPPVLNRCSTKSSADACTARGGTPGSGSCCDAACVPSPSGAFLE